MTPSPKGLNEFNHELGLFQHPNKPGKLGIHAGHASYGLQNDQISPPSSVKVCLVDPETHCSYNRSNCKLLLLVICSTG